MKDRCLPIFDNPVEINPFIMHQKTFKIFKVSFKIAKPCMWGKKEIMGKMKQYV